LARLKPLPLPWTEVFTPSQDLQTNARRRAVRSDRLLVSAVSLLWEAPKLPRLDMRELNSKLSTINRVVIHPKYRTIGLCAKLIHETLSLAGTPFVELVAVMAKYSPFAEEAGMRKVAVQEPSKDILRVAKALEALGFDVRLLGSQRYVLGKLQRLSYEKIAFLRDCLQRCGHPRFRKEFAISRHVPYGKLRGVQKMH
jgi:ABC-type ATPase with predicted acetyltransferase domain